MTYTLPQQTTKMKPLSEWSGEVGKCTHGHVLRPSTKQSCLGWAFCVDCAEANEGKYWDIYYVPDKDWSPEITGV